MFCSTQKASSGPLSQAFASTKSRQPSDGSSGLDVKSRASGSPAQGLGRLIANVEGKKSTLKLVIKDARAQSTLPTGYAGTAMTNLTRALRSLLSSTATSYPGSLESLYTSTEALVSVAHQGSDLYDRVKLEMERAVGDIARELRAEASTEGKFSGKAWLIKLEETWTGWCNRMSLVCSILLPLDRAFVLEQHDLLPTWDLALDIFKLKVVEDEELQQRAINAIIAIINSERNGTPQQRDLHSSLLSMLVTLSSYEILESALHIATLEFYGAESERLIAQLSTAEYLRHAESRITEEEGRALWVLRGESGQNEYVKIVVEELVGKHVDTLVKGLPDLIAEEGTPDLGRCYVLLKRVRALPTLRSAFATYIRATGETIVLDKAKDDEMVDRLLQYKARIDAAVAGPFQGDIEFGHAQKESFEVFVNKRENRPAELIAKYLDVKLKSGNKSMSDAELEHLLNEALILFRYTHDKDMFEEFYKRHFAKRLLLNKSASSDAERSMLLKLKEECGAGFTAKLETMLKDIELSDDIMKAYNTLRDKNAADGESDAFELSVNVLTQAHWPTYPQVEIIIPPEMAQATERFRTFYQGRNAGRKLYWQHSLGTNALRAHFPKGGVKELQVSTFQTAVLLLFNNLEAGAKLSYKNIAQQTALEDTELKRTLQSLACGQVRVLRKLPTSKDVNDTDEFMFNEAFKSDRHRIRINQIQMKETAEEQKSTEQRVFLDRELVLQAAAVRILKARKQIKHAELVTEVVDQIKSRFAVDVGEIKKAFEILIDKEYMERVEGERGVYRYLA